MQLLKDKPEFKETIENNIFFRNELLEILESSDFEISFETDKQDIITEIVEKINKYSEDIKLGDDKIGEAVTDKQGLAIAIFEVFDSYTGEVELESKDQTVDELIDSISAFVKENYGLSIKEAYKQSIGII